MDTEHSVFTLLIEAATDVPRAWVVHVIEVDIVSYGFSVREALELGREAAVEVVVDDRAQAVAPRRQAPDDVRQRAARVEREGTALSLEEVEIRAAQCEELHLLAVVDPRRPIGAGHRVTVLAGSM